MNHMAEVAKMIGVELGEKFDVGPYNVTYVILDDGVHNVSSGLLCPDSLNSLLSGKWIIKRKPWKPKDDEEYWLVNQCGNVISLNWIDNFLCITNYKIGNCYRTKEEAEANRDKWIAFYASDEVLEV